MTTCAFAVQLAGARAEELATAVTVVIDGPAVAFGNRGCQCDTASAMGLSLVIPILVTLLLAWLALLALLVAIRPKGVDLREAHAFVPDLVRLISRLARDPSLRRGTRLRLSLLLAYLAFPVDLVPDFIPVLGYADDLILVAVALRAVVRLLDAGALDEHWTGSDLGLAALRRMAGLPRA